MTKEEALRKLKKLEGMLRATPNEAKNARLLIERLIKKYQIEPEDIEAKKEWRTYKLHRLKKYGIHLAKWMRVQVRTVGGQPDYVTIEVDSDEYRMFYELIGEIKHQFNKHIRIFEGEAREALEQKGITTYPKSALNKIKNDMLKSFMKGYMNTNYPYDPDMCFVCWEGKIIRYPGGKVQCDSCGVLYGTTKYQGFNHYSDAMMKGVNTTTKSIRQNRLAITG